MDDNQFPTLEFSPLQRGDNYLYHTPVDPEYASYHLGKRNYYGDKPDEKKWEVMVRPHSGAGGFWAGHADTLEEAGRMIVLHKKFMDGIAELFIAETETYKNLCAQAGIKDSFITSMMINDWVQRLQQQAEHGHL